jgi:hypothetical protein
MKSTSTSTKKQRTKKLDRPTKISSLSEEERVLAFLKKEGFRPMTAKEKRDLAAIGCLGMPEE